MADVLFRLPTFAEVRPLFEKSTSSATFSIFGLAINVRNVLFGISGNLSLMHDELTAYDGWEGYTSCAARGVR